MGFDLGDRQITEPVLLAPLAGITDLPFRTLVSRFGAGLVVSEMIASGEFLTERPGTREKAELGAQIENTSVQIAGREAGPMAEAARMVADMGARVIDINMGCPAKKVTGGWSGSALMQVPDHALRLIEAVVAAVDLPVTLKTRLGWDNDCLNAAEIARRAEAAGVRMIVIHGRTRCQFYKGSADWAAISEVKNAVQVPVIANGDVVSPATARQALARSGADGVMIGRGAQGAPWRLAQVAHALYGAPAPVVPQGTDLVDMVSGHYDAMLAFYGKTLGNRVARKHLGWYMDEAGTPAALRKRLLTERDTGAVLNLLPEALLTPAEAA
ncbi:tRNA dihydrouridine synthase DusB [Mameliella sediminis]|uniref:tRNA dihydrouridine synthase DusB n=1 Tax=Mameliella sediminis TaxID=2836866 RepID=UPI001C463976|nr:tRNA dihydrouridine synthase DusB [Mameliella sediminis]MBY6114701.1 tRNA dihydrouridine synthase DusB [Antarctobacter heliothermus]MBY6144274.1 tRNA dihydrouridine synthase DusB [Mameliella alba]MBV7392818.1 tRNA dihydrouridine synthase DusB [Mameliella sediminis]MBY6161435.1 tRNA dihydrouridine synthase DusB [Mameliella alba]MBY6170099.1 tRNA dihydrouridine synthase DusB [Mameliella alba]